MEISFVPSNAIINEIKLNDHINHSLRMGAWVRYIDPETGKTMMITFESREGDHVFGFTTSRFEKEASIHINYNLRQAFAWCKLNPIDDLARKELTGEESVIILITALERAKNLSDELFRLSAINQRCARIERMTQEAITSELEETWATVRLSFELEKNIANISKPIWEVNKDALIKVYETLLSWAEYRPDGYFQLGDQ